MDAEVFEQLRLPPDWTSLSREKGESRPLTLVVMSTWNGAAFIDEQLSSVLRQSFAGTLRVLIRDDGSVDDTPERIARLNDPRVFVWRGINLGAKTSFFALLDAAREIEFDFLAFADQDDVWLPSKLAVAIRALQKVEAADSAMYCSAVTLVDASLKTIAHYSYRSRIELKSMLVSNCATGCTLVMNRDLVNRLTPLPAPSQVWMHDWWFALVASAVGTLLYDEQSHILYRQHNANQIGLPFGLRGVLNRVRRRWNRASGPSRISQAQALLDLYRTTLAPTQITLLERFVRGRSNMIERLRFAIFEWPARGFLSRLAFVKGGH